MTNYEHMTKEEKEMAVKYGFHKENREIKVCANYCNVSCPRYVECKANVTAREIFRWLESEHKPPKTETEKFCETLKVGELIVVGALGEEGLTNTLYCKFSRYDAISDSIVSSYGNHWKHGRKLTATERGE